MLITDYKLKDFSDSFNKKIRKKANHTTKFKILKRELNEHLSKFEKTTKDFKDLKIFTEGNSLCFSYEETTNQKMLIRLMWRLNDLGPNDILKMVDDFAKKELEIKTKPIVNIVYSFMYQNMALYWPKQKQIDISLFTINQLDEETVLKLIKHEMIHYYLDINGKDADDTSDDFIEMVINHEAYVSAEESAAKAYKEYKKRNKK